MITKDRLHRLVDTLPESEVDTAARVLEALAVAADPVARSLTSAPADDELVTSAEAEAAAEARADVAAGRVSSLEDTQRELGLS